MHRDELKPCPFCGWTEIYIEPDERGSGGQWVLPLHVGCCLCGVNILCTDAETEEEAAKVWNRRAALTAALSEQTLPVRVKALTWKKLAAQDRNAEVADSVLGRWEVWHFPAGKTYVMKPGEHQGTVFEDGLDEAKAHMERAYQRRMAPALVDVPAVEPEPVAWLKLVKMTPISGDEYQALWLTDETDEKGFPVFAHPPVSALVNAQADADVVERWQPIETAPRDRRKILLWAEMWLHPVVGYWSKTINAWLEYGSRDAKANVATHWQPLPVPPSLRTLGSAGVGSASKSKGCAE